MKTKHKMVWLACAGMLACGTSAFAVTNVWNGNANDGSWGTTGNWSLNHVPIANTEDVTIGDGYGVINLGGNQGVAGVVVNLGASALSNGDFNTSSTTTLTANNTIFAKDGAWWGGGSVRTGFRNPVGDGIGNLTLNNVNYLDNDAFWPVRQNDTVNITGGVVKLGNGYLDVYGYNGTGTVNINGGSHYFQNLEANGIDGAGPNADPNAVTISITGGAVVGYGRCRGIGTETGSGPSTLSLISSTLVSQDSQNGWSFGPSAIFTSQYGTLSPRGNFANGMTNQNQWSGYLIFREQAVYPTNLFEVAGIDYGANTNLNTGVGANYSVTRLQLNAGVFQLANSFDNNVGITHGAEALYVGELDLLSDTTIDLHGLNLYYNDLNRHGFTLTLEDTVGGGLFLQSIPEPTSLGLLGLCGIAMLARRRCR